MHLPASPHVIYKAQSSEENWELFFSLLTSRNESTFSLCDIRTSWRVIPINHPRSTRECDSETVMASFLEFREWVEGRDVVELKTHPFHLLPSYATENVAVYADYKYFIELFSEENLSNIDSVDLCLFEQALIFINRNDRNPVKLLDWGLYKHVPEEMGVESSTMWMGSKGAHTPLHYDTYGTNVIMQIQGCKEWHFWAPSAENMHLLKPKRIPYEESSVYCNYDPLFSRNGDCDFVTPDLTLEISAGDVLIVPKHWWHFVRTTSETSMSVNMWVPAERCSVEKCNVSISETSSQMAAVNSDAKDRATEAIARFIFGSFKNSIDSMDWSSHSKASHCEVISQNGWDNLNSLSDRESKVEESTEISDGGSIVDAESNYCLIVEAIKQLRSEVGATSMSDEHTASEKRILLKKLLNALLQPKVLQSCLDEILCEQEV